MQPFQVSDPILVAAATPVEFPFAQLRSSVGVMIVFYDTAAALPADEIAAGTGTRDVTVDCEINGWDAAGVALGPTRSLIENGTATAMPARTLQGFVFPGGVKNCRVAAVQNVDPGGAVAYRIWVIG